MAIFQQWLFSLSFFHKCYMCYLVITFSHLSYWSLQFLQKSIYYFSYWSFFFFAWPFWFSGWSCIGLRFCYALANAGLHSALWDIKSFMHCFWTMLFTILTKIFTHPGKSLNSGAQIIHIYPASRCRLLLPTFVKLLVTFRSLIICYLCNKCCGLADARRTALARVYRFRETHCFAQNANWSFEQLCIQLGQFGYFCSKICYYSFFCRLWAFQKLFRKRDDYCSCINIEETFVIQLQLMKV